MRQYSTSLCLEDVTRELMTVFVPGPDLDQRDTSSTAQVACRKTLNAVVV